MTLEDCARNVPKRISRLENFLRKRLPPSELNKIRYYEVCVVESKGALLVRFLILTSDSVLVTENPPKTLLKVIRLSQIQDISLVADRKPLLTGSQGSTPFICQHVSLVYKDWSGDAAGTDMKGNATDRLGKDEGYGSYLSSGNSWSSSSDDSTASRLDSVTELPEFDCPFYSENGSSGTMDIMPSFLRRLYDPFVEVPSNSGYSPGGSLNLEKTKDDLLLLSKDNSDAKSLESVSTSATSTSGENGDDIAFSGSHGNSSDTGKRNTPDRLSPSSPHDQERLSSSPWSSDSGIGANDIPKDRPESVDSELSSGSSNYSRISMLSRYFTRKTNKTIKGTSTPTSSERIPKVFKDEATMIIAPKLDELNFYVYQQESTLLNELHLLWNRSNLTYGLHKENSFILVPPSPRTKEEQSSLRATDKAMVDAMEKKLFIYSANPASQQLLPLLIGFQQKLENRQYLRSLCWKSPNLMGNMVKIVQSCVSPEKEGRRRRGLDDDGDDYGREEAEEEESFLQRVMTFTVLMDIFRLLFESCCSTSFWSQTNTTTATTTTTRKEPRRRTVCAENTYFNACTTVTSNLLHVLFSYPMSAMKMPGRIKILRVIFDPQAYAKLDWTTSAESKVIKALTIAHNATVTLLHEILLLLYFSPREHEKITFMTLFSKYSLEPYVKQSVTQIINLLWPLRQPLKPNQCSLLYRHVYVLNVLLDNLPSIKKFVRISFCEEFQYFIHWNCIAMKVSDRFPIKPKLQQAFEELRQEIIQREE